MSDISEDLAELLTIFGGLKKFKTVSQQRDKAKVYMVRFTLKTLNYVEDKELYQIYISNQFAPLETQMITWTLTEAEKE
jgi:hypothetical protein